MSQVCAFASPFSASLSAIAIFRQLTRKHRNFGRNNRIGTPF
jgi:hypothetical protein